MATGSRAKGALVEAIATALRVESARIKMGVGQLSQLSGLPQSTVSKTLAGKRAIDVEELEKLCAPLDLDPADVIDQARKEVEEAQHTASKRHLTAVTMTNDQETQDLPQMRPLSERLKLLTDLYAIEHSQPLTQEEVTSAISKQGVTLDEHLWRELLTGTSTGTVDVLVALARFFDIDEIYLLASDPSVTDRIDAELELLLTMRRAGVTQFAARTLGETSPETLRTIIQAINATNPESSR